MLTTFASWLFAAIILVFGVPAAIVLAVLTVAGEGLVAIASQWSTWLMVGLAIALTITAIHCTRTKQWKELKGFGAVGLGALFAGGQVWVARTVAERIGTPSADNFLRERAEGLIATLPTAIAGVLALVTILMGCLAAYEEYQFWRWRFATE